MELCMSYLTTCGASFGELPKHGVTERSFAAFRAGFNSVGMALDDLMPDIRHGYPLPVPVTELEWADVTAPDWDGIRELMRVAVILGTVRRINAGSATNDRTGYEASNLRTLAMMAADHNLSVVVEPVSFGSFATVDSVASLIGDAGGYNMSVLYDTWHVWRMTGELAPVDTSLVGSVQISGTDAIYDTATDRVAAMNRMLPTDGIDSKEVTEFLRGLFASGYNGPVGVESPSARFRARECAGNAVLAHMAATEVICEAL